MAKWLAGIPGEDEGQQLGASHIPAHQNRSLIRQGCPQLFDGKRLHLLAEGETGVDRLDLFLDQTIQLLFELQQVFAHSLGSFLLNPLKSKRSCSLRPTDSIESRHGLACEAVG